VRRQMVDAVLILPRPRQHDSRTPAGALSIGPDAASTATKPEPQKIDPSARSITDGSIFPLRPCAAQVMK
jgi:hypothetical protein